jgi:uncharacterized cupin superfamily protein
MRFRLWRACLVQLLALEGLAMWSVWQPDRSLYFNAFFLQRPEGNIVVDPLPASETDLAFMRDRGGVRWVVLTHPEREPAARELATAFGATVATGAGTAQVLHGPIERLLKDGEELASGIRIIEIESSRKPGEIALSLPELRAAIVGDGLRGEPAGAVCMPPDDLLSDPGRTALSLRRIWALTLDVLLVGQGACIFGGADALIGRCLQGRHDVFVNRINLDEAPAEPRVGAGGKYESLRQELGLLIGARKLGYQVVTVEPGKRYCPLHAEQYEEEVFIVLDGHPTIRTLHGEFVCRPGDVIAFPPGDAGSHQLLNAGTTSCRVFMLGMDGMEGLSGVTYYPDSDKFLISASGRRVIVRGSPQLDYYDGE